MERRRMWNWGWSQPELWAGLLYGSVVTLLWVGVSLLVLRPLTQVVLGAGLGG